MFRFKSRRDRAVLISVALLLMVFVFISTNRAQVAIPPPAADSTKLSTGTGADGINEQAIKSNEDDIRQKLQGSGNGAAAVAPIANANAGGSTGGSSGGSSGGSAASGDRHAGLVDSSVVSGNANGAKKPLANAATEDAHDKLIANTGAKGVPKGIAKGSPADSNTENEFDAATEFNSIMTLSPVVIFSKTYCGYSKALKKLLTSEYELTPNPTIVELDKHTHGRELQDYIAAKTGRKTVPNLFVGGVSRGGSDDIKKLHDEGSLSKYLNQWGNKQIKVSKVSAPSNS